MLPKQLSDWTVQAATDLLRVGIFESESFDYKETLPTPKMRVARIDCDTPAVPSPTAMGAFWFSGYRMTNQKVQRTGSSVWMLTSIFRSNLAIIHAVVLPRSVGHF